MFGNDYIVCYVMLLRAALAAAVRVGGPDGRSGRDPADDQLGAALRVRRRHGLRAALLVSAAHQVRPPRLASLTDH